MKTIYILITALLLFTTPTFAQLDGLLGDIMEEVQDKVGDTQQDAADTASMKAFRNELKDILAGINGLDKYSKELKCIYVILKLASTYEHYGLEAKNAALCKEKYDYYGMQLMVLASTGLVGYCFDDITELIPSKDEEDIFDVGNYEKYLQLLNEYIETTAPFMVSGISHSNSALEKDFIATLGLALITSEFMTSESTEDQSLALLHSHIDHLLRYLILEYNPVTALGKSMKLGIKMKALPCSDGRS